MDEIMDSVGLLWFRQAQQREENNVARRTMNLALRGDRRRGRPRKTWKQQIREYMSEVGVRVDMVLDCKERRRRTMRSYYKKYVCKIPRLNVVRLH